MSVLISILCTTMLIPRASAQGEYPTAPLPTPSSATAPPADPYSTEGLEPTGMQATPNLPGEARQEWKGVWRDFMKTEDPDPVRAFIDRYGPFGTDDIPELELAVRLIDPDYSYQRDDLKSVQRADRDYGGIIDKGGLGLTLAPSAVLDDTALAFGGGALVEAEALWVDRGDFPFDQNGFSLTLAGDYHKSSQGTGLDTWANVAYGPGFDGPMLQLGLGGGLVGVLDDPTPGLHEYLQYRYCESGRNYYCIGGRVEQQQVLADPMTHLTAVRFVLSCGFGDVD